MTNKSDVSAITAHDAVHILRLELVQAECAIKGREHTGFITKALVATEHIFGQATERAAIQPAACLSCKGSGEERGAQGYPCPKCDGLGEPLTAPVAIQPAGDAVRDALELANDALTAAWSFVKDCDDIADKVNKAGIAISAILHPEESTPAAPVASAPAQPMDSTTMLLRLSRHLQASGWEFRGEGSAFDTMLPAVTSAGFAAPAQLDGDAERVAASVVITLRQAQTLVAFFGGNDCEVTVTERPSDWGDAAPSGLYAYCTEYPSEGTEYLGKTEVGHE